MVSLSVNRRPCHLLRYLSTTTTTTTTTATTTTTTTTTCPPTGGTHAFEPALRRLVRSKNFAEIESILESRKTQNSTTPSSSESHFSSIVTSYVCSGMLDHALRTLYQIPRPTPLSLNALLSACNHHPKLFRSVPDLFHQQSKKLSVSPDKVSYGILIKSLCRSRVPPSECFKVLDEMKEKNIEITAVTYTTIINSLYKEKKPAEAERLWEEMRAAGIEPDVPAYNVRVMYKASRGDLDGVLDVVKEMEAAGLEPDTITYTYLIGCYCRGNKFAEARKVYEGMKERGCTMNYSTYKNYVMELCKVGDLDGAVLVFNDALKEKKVPELSVVKTLVRSLVKAKKSRTAKRVVTGLRKKFSEDFTRRWLELEKIVGLDKGGEEGDDKVVAS